MDVKKISTLATKQQHNILDGQKDKLTWRDNKRSETKWTRQIKVIKKKNSEKLLWCGIRDNLGIPEETISCRTKHGWKI